jgi:hypothetical protein
VSAGGTYASRAPADRARSDLPESSATLLDDTQPMKMEPGPQAEHPPQDPESVAEAQDMELDDAEQALLNEELFSPQDPDVLAGALSPEALLAADTQVGPDGHDAEPLTSVASPEALPQPDSCLPEIHEIQADVSVPDESVDQDTQMPVLAPATFPLPDSAETHTSQLEVSVAAESREAPLAPSSTKSQLQNQMLQDVHADIVRMCEVGGVITEAC